MTDHALAAAAIEDALAGLPDHEAVEDAFRILDDEQPPSVEDQCVRTALAVIVTLARDLPRGSRARRALAEAAVPLRDLV